MPFSSIEVDGDGRKHCRIVASDRSATDVKVTEVADISSVGIGISAGTHHPEGVATIGIDRRPPCTTTFGIERGAESFGWVVNTTAGIEAIGSSGGGGINLVSRKDEDTVDR